MTPYAFFGHSMGALVAFELSRALRRQGLPLPRTIVVSGRRPPPYRTLNRRSIYFPMMRSWMRWSGAMTAIPQVIRDEPELMALFVPVLKADFATFETHVHQDEPPLPCAVSIYGGRDDPQTRQMDGWASLFSGPSRFRLFDGGHFTLPSSVRPWRRHWRRMPWRRFWSTRQDACRILVPTRAIRRSPGSEICWALVWASRPRRSILASGCTVMG